MNTNLIIEAINKRLFYDYELNEYLRCILISEDEIKEIVEEIQNIMKYAYELADKIWDKSLSQRKANKMILQNYSYLSNNEVNIIFGKALFELR